MRLVSFSFMIFSLLGSKYCRWPVRLSAVICEKSSHNSGFGSNAGSEQKMGVIRKQGPSIAGSGGLGQFTSETIQEAVPYSMVPEYLLALYPPFNDMM